MKKFVLIVSLGSAIVAGGCNDDSASNNSPAAAPSGSSGAAAPAATPSTAAAAPHSRIPIGEKTISGLKLVATMDEPIKAAGGGEGAFDVVLTGGKPKAVRFWVGTEDAKGSIKAKAEEETTENWHTHAEVPNPLPPGSKFWVEVEPPTGDKFTTSFELKTQ